ncbi:N-6 DNA methylase [Gelidibacter japonicus]|uniref:N-6 DNA methylase n=1 Tax=Gelidibacter japonicus TaxID=1962232 RepID=UPI003A8DB641
MSKISQSFKQIDNLFSKVYNNLRGRVKSDDFDILLFLISIQKDGFDKISINEDTLRLFHIEFKYWSKYDRYSEVYKIFKPKIDLLSEIDFQFLLIELYEIKFSFLQSNFIEIFENLLVKIVDQKRIDSADSLQPHEVSQLVIELAELDSNAEIYNPFAGFASFGIFLKNEQKYYGQEILTNVWSIGQLRLMAHRLNHNNYENGDSTENWLENKSFDLVTCIPPFGKSKGTGFESRNGDYILKSYYAYAIDKSISSIKDSGLAIIVVPEGFCFSQSKHETAQKKYLLENNFLDKVISLPAGIFYNTGVKTSIIVLRKDRLPKEPIMMYDLSGSYYSGNKKRRLNLNEALEFLEDENDIYGLSVTASQIVESNFNYSVGSHNIVSIYSGTPLSDFFSIERGKFAPKMDKYPVIGINDIINATPYLNQIQNKVLPLKGRPNIVVGECLFIDTTRSSIRSAISKDGEVNYFSHHNIIVLRPKKEYGINLEYIHHILKSDDIQEQIRILKGGITQLFRIRQDELLSLKISLPSIEEQNKYVIGQMMSVIRKEEASLNRLKIEAGINEADGVSYLRHSMAGSVKNARDSFSKVLDIFNNQIFTLYPELKDLTSTPRSKITLGKHLSIISTDLSEIKDTLSRTNLEIDLRTMKEMGIDFISFITEYTKVLEANRDLEFKTIFKYDQSLIDGNNIDSIYILGNKKMLRKALDNIVENAVKHAFIDEPSPLIEFEIMFDFESDNMLQLDISNNGKTLPKNFSIDDLTRKGQSVGKNGGDGYGGYLIKKIIEAHNGRVDITDESGPEGFDYPRISTSFEITLPFSTNKEEYV